LFSRRLTPVFDMRSYEEALRAAAGPAAGCLTMRRQRVAGSLSETLLAEARKGYHFLVVGASGRGHPIRDPVVAELARGTPCHLMVVAARARSSEPAAAFRRILVPTNGTYAAEAAFEVAARYAEATGAGLSACYVIERNRFNPLLPAAVEHADQEARNLIRLTLRQQLSERFRHPERLECRVRESDSLLTGLLEEVGAGEYDLVMLGAENRSLVDRFYPSRQIEEVLAAIPCSVALMVPKFGFHAPHTG
jgi:nucleotide-binding universal stress UspA family protein